MATSVILNRHLPGKAALVWQVISGREHLSVWFLTLPTDLELELTFKPLFVDEIEWQVSRLVSLALVEFTTLAYVTKGVTATIGKVSWRLVQDNGAVTLNIIDQSLVKAFPFSYFEKRRRERLWHQIINNLECYLEEITGKNSY